MTAQFDARCVATLTDRVFEAPSGLGGGLLLGECVKWRYSISSARGDVTNVFSTVKTKHASSPVFNFNPLISWANYYSYDNVRNRWPPKEDTRGCCFAGSCLSLASILIDHNCDPVVVAYRTIASRFFCRRGTHFGRHQVSTAMFLASIARY